jgi:DNA-binding response OmpR family regulator
MNSKRTTRPAPPPRQNVKRTILLVDDDPAVRQMIGRVLANEGYLVLCAANGAEALGIAAANHVDLALLDLNMPVQNGWDTFERLTAENPFIAVIIITARPNQLFTALGAGAGALLEKPLDFPVLLKTIKTLLAESAELRLARLAGRRAEFHYLPAPGEEVSR